jgi:hypothetical protein
VVSVAPPFPSFGGKQLYWPRSGCNCSNGVNVRTGRTEFLRNAVQLLCLVGLAQACY